MKRILLIAALATLLLSATSLKAQLGFHAGYAPQTLSVAATANDLPANPSTRMQGFFGGVHYNRTVVGDLGLTAAVQIRLNSATSNTAEYTFQDWQFIADLPILLNYGVTVADNLTLGAFAGPVLSYGISYTQKTADAETYEVITSTDRYGTSAPASALKRFEASAAGGMFLKYKGFVLFGGYRLGLNDLDRMNDCTTKTRGFFVGIGVD